jgi:hypothetical protein
MALRYHTTSLNVTIAEMFCIREVHGLNLSPRAGKCQYITLN